MNSTPNDGTVINQWFDRRVSDIPKTYHADGTVSYHQPDTGATNTSTYDIPEPGYFALTAAIPPRDEFNPLEGPYEVTAQLGDDVAVYRMNEAEATKYMMFLFKVFALRGYDGPNLKPGEWVMHRPGYPSLTISNRQVES